MKAADKNPRKRIGFVAAVPLSVNVFLRPHIELLMQDYDVVVLCNGCEQDFGDWMSDRICFHPVPIERPISPFKDLIALLKMWKLLCKLRLDSIHSITPKAGLLAMTAGRLAGIPVRLHMFTGQVWATKKGFMRGLLKSADRWIVKHATHVLADSDSQRQFIVDENVAGEKSIEVLAEGSISGVNLTRFQYDSKIRQTIRDGFKIPDDAVVFIFIGRLNRDKGVLDLAQAFAKAAKDQPAMHLLVVGPDEQGIENGFRSHLESVQDRVHRMDHTSTPEHVLTASDVFCLPSYREGFGSVLIEAAAVGLPAIASRIYGITDAVKEGETGILHPPGSISELAQAMVRLATDAEFRKAMGAEAQKRAHAEFSEDRVTKAWADLYHRLLPIEPNRGN